MVVIVKIRLRVPRFAPLAAVACLALCPSSTADMPPALAIRVAIPEPDPRIARLERFFHKYHCPTPLHVSDYLHAADGNQLDYRLLPAISIRETRCGVEQAENNWWGFHNGDFGFSSVEEGIKFMANRLAAHPYYKGKTLLEKLFTYNPLPAYPGEVTRIMSQIEDSVAGPDVD